MTLVFVVHLFKFHGVVHLRCHLSVIEQTRSARTSTEVTCGDCCDAVLACSAWLRDEEHVLIDRISRRTNAITNLTLDSVEELQVPNHAERA